MRVGGNRHFGCLVLLLLWAASAGHARAQTTPLPVAPGASSKPHSLKERRARISNPEIDAGSVSNGVYRNRALGFSCKIPAVWVLRTEEMNAREQDSHTQDRSASEEKSQPQKDTGERSAGRVLLAAFSRPPEAAGEDVNSSILIAAESAAAYPGLTEAAQYLGPVEEVAKAQGFAVVHEPYEIAVGAKALAREDFQKDVGSRVLRQSTLVMLGRGYAVSFTFIGGTEDEVEELIDSLSFAVAAKTAK